MNKSAEIAVVSSHSYCLYHQQHRKIIDSCISVVTINGKTYTLEDYIVINGKKDIEIIKFICIYSSDNQTFCTVLRKFVLARSIRPLFQSQGLNFDEDNEVVEDMSVHRIDLNLIANSVERKCTILLLSEEEDPSDVIELQNMDRENFFVCRFSMKSKSLYPKFPTEQTILTENFYKSPVVKKMYESSSDEMSIEITHSTYVEDRKKNNKDLDLFSPPQRNSVKRNLNKSFGNSPHDHNKSILNYSVVTISDDENDDQPMNYSIVNNGDIENDNRMVIKLKVRRDNNILNDIPSNVRKSNRNMEQKFYLESTPTKRTRKPSVDEDYPHSSYKVPRETPKKSSSRKLRTEVTRSSTRSRVTPQRYIDEVAFSNVSRSSTRSRIAPQRYIDEVASSWYCDEVVISDACTRRGTSARRHLELNQLHELETPRSSQIPKANEEDIGIDNLEGVNLDDSITKTLKIKITRLNPEAERVIRETPNCEVEILESEKEEEEEEVKMPKGSMNPRTLRSKRKPPTPINTDTESDFDTPAKTQRNTSVQKSTCETTPKRVTAKQTPKHSSHNRARLIRDGIITPSMQARSRKVSGVSTPLMRARSQLHVSYVPESLPCREKEYCDVFNFVEGKLLDKCGGCIYVSGVPGTGKTATVTSVINSLLKNDNVPKFTFVNVNGMRLTEPRQAYVEILKQLQGKSVPWEQAQSMLDDIFNKSKKLQPVVMLIDELDVLCTKRQDVVYNLLDWPTKAKNQLVVITIANTMDLPERLLMSRVTSRLGLTRLTFNAYTHKQLQEIVTRRLCGTDSFKPDAVQFVARKVASVSGDARRALDICRRAAEIAESEGKGQLVGMGHVNEALNAMITQPKIQAIKHCSRLEQLIMQSVVAEVERTGVEETTFADVFKMLETCATLEGFKMVSTTVTLSAIARLGACRLILTDQKSSDIYQRIILNVSGDDVYYALKNC